VGGRPALGLAARGVGEPAGRRGRRATAPLALGWGRSSRTSRADHPSTGEVSSASGRVRALRRRWRPSRALPDARAPRRSSRTPAGPSPGTSSGSDYRIGAIATSARGSVHAAPVGPSRWRAMPGPTARNAAAAALARARRGAAAVAALVDSAAWPAASAPRGSLRRFVDSCPPARRSPPPCRRPRWLAPGGVLHQPLVRPQALGRTATASPMPTCCWSRDLPRRGLAGVTGKIVDAVDAHLWKHGVAPDARRPRQLPRHTLRPSDLCLTLGASPTGERARPALRILEARTR
jgi:hypothetical protein